jgi:hypothetical protein
VADVANASQLYFCFVPSAVAIAAVEGLTRQARRLQMWDRRGVTIGA